LVLAELVDGRVAPGQMAQTVKHQQSRLIRMFTTQLVEEVVVVMYDEQVQAEDLVVVAHSITPVVRQ
jgi:chorismate mutase